MCDGAINNHLRLETSFSTPSFTACFFFYFVDHMREREKEQSRLSQLVPKQTSFPSSKLEMILKHLLMMMKMMMMTRKNQPYKMAANVAERLLF